MNIVVDLSVAEQPFTGVAKATLGLYNACLKRARKLTVRGIHRLPLAGPLPPGVEDWTSGARCPRPLWRRLWLPWVTRKRGIDVLHFPWNGHIPRCSPRGVVTVATVCDVLPLEIPNYFADASELAAYRKRLQRDLLRADLVLTISEYSKSTILKYFKTRTEPVISAPGPTLKYPARPTGSFSGMRYFVYLGGYDPRKGIEPLLQVYTDLYSQKRLGAQLVLVGERKIYSQRLRELLRAAEGCGAVVERGYVPDSELAELLIGARGLIYPSRYEGFGLPPLEAMALGCPVITTRGTALPEICGDAALYVDPDNAQEFAEAILLLDGSQGVRAERKAKGVEQSKRFSWDNAAAAYLNALRPLVANAEDV